MIANNRTLRALFLASACLLGCAKKAGQEAATETPDTLSATTDTLPKTPDTLSITYDTLTDTRDGKAYKTVKIGKQIWMAQNLNYETPSGSWCYNDRDSYCKKYGRLYSWWAAKSVCQSLGSGWRLPARADWDNLALAVGGQLYERPSLPEWHMPNMPKWHVWESAGRELKSSSGWYNNGNGTDAYGYSALPGGFRGMGEGFGEVGEYAYWWASEESITENAYIRYVYYNCDTLGEEARYQSFGFSVRCVMDAAPNPPKESSHDNR
jgi:uncharacterized protein (TIGR02145 family)